jgi:hypothetical protein
MRIDRDTGQWDTLLLLGANLGLLGSVSSARILLARFDDATGNGARIIAESRDPTMITDPIHVEYQEANRQRGRLPGQLRIRIRYAAYATPWFEYLFVTKLELDTILEGTGWHATRYLDGEQGSGTYIALIEKTGRAESE